MSKHSDQEDTGRWGLHPLALGVLILMVLGLALVGFARFWGGSASTVTEPPPSGGAVSEPPQVSESVAPAIVVYVSGAVVSPGVQELPAGSRVADAIQGAAGTTQDANLAVINLARILVDGEQIHVSTAGEAVEQTADQPQTGQIMPTCVDINLASEVELQTLTGIGPKLAERIVNHRTDNGPFSTNEALLEVSGIGEKLLGGISGELC